VSDFDNFDDLDVVRDFRSLVSPYPDEVDDAVRQRIVELAAERGYRQVGETESPVELSAGTAGATGSWCVSNPDERAGVASGVPVVELRSLGRTRSRRHYRFLMAVGVAVVMAFAAGVAARDRTPIETLDMGGVAPLDDGSQTGGALGLTASEPSADDGSEAGRGGEADAPDAELTVASLLDLVGAQPDRPVPEHQYEYRKVERAGMADVLGGGPAGGGVFHEVSERWASPGWPGRTLTTRSDPSAGSGSPVAPVEQELRVDGAFDGLPYGFLRGLATDPDQLRSELVNELRRRGVPFGSEVEVICDRLADRFLRPRVRVALVQALVDRGLAAVGPVTDTRGRRGAGFSLADGADEWTVVIDPRDGSLRSWEARRGDGRVIASLVIVETVIVNEAGRP
jgi:hypothetical protein